MNYKAGDTVRIQSQEWMDAQEKDVGGDITKDYGCYINQIMQQCAGRVFTALGVHDRYYLLEGMSWHWQDWMFDPDYRPEGPISAEDAIRAMLDGEVLYTSEGNRCVKHNDGACYVVLENTGRHLHWLNCFDNLYRRPAKCKRPMTQDEARAWAESEDSLGWMAHIEGFDGWDFPRKFEYNHDITSYQRVKILPDRSGIDESTIQGFEVEE
jgi:hypothetical protein